MVITYSQYQSTERQDHPGKSNEMNVLGNQLSRKTERRPETQLIIEK